MTIQYADAPASSPAPALAPQARPCPLCGARLAARDWDDHYEQAHGDEA